MATGRSSFAKRQRDMHKKARAEAKRQKRLGRGELYELEHAHRNGDEQVETEADAPKLSNDEIVAQLEELHRQYGSDEMDLEEFDERRAALMAQISVD
ncbi:MAG: hypothetical protein OXE79_01715 [Acidimicrobiaceae bacterium]|nr:hypothetical protein [Acidimicrobiaceae bacterium]MCY4175897.1 hypothetical protein [Acidimicrobiaceae bacterium]MCY4280876.1 hypothetical protein [Acidimicrobiaceae bacterium]MCY4293319.1 hypothetical protein [Acidimicrobiaceae bacterium]